jgi:hypothetical protein
LKCHNVTRLCTNFEIDFFKLLALFDYDFSSRLDLSLISKDINQREPTAYRTLIQHLYKVEFKSYICFFDQDMYTFLFSRLGTVRAPMAFLVRIFISVFIVGITLYAYIDKINTLTELRIQVPELAKELKNREEEIVRLQFEKEKFENPISLMELSRKPAYGHLKHPILTEIITVDTTRPEPTIVPTERERYSFEKSRPHAGE